ncbi:MAG: hypothetical protein ACLP59_01945 [Bryobacteraceae bacterium]
MLDSTAVVAAEREGKTARQLLESMALETGDDSIALAVITVMELAHAIAAVIGWIGRPINSSSLCVQVG